MRGFRVQSSKTFEMNCSRIFITKLNLPEYSVAMPYGNLRSCFLATPVCVTYFDNLTKALLA